MITRPRTHKYKDTKSLPELRAAQRQGKCIICHKKITDTHRSATACPGECRERYKYAENLHHSMTSHRRKSPYADTPPMEELRARHEPGKCVICDKRLLPYAAARRAMSCIGECRSRFLYAQNRFTTERMSPEKLAERHHQANLRRSLKYLQADDPPMPGLPCNLDPRRAMDPIREAIANIELRGSRFLQQEEQGDEANAA